MFYFPYNLLSFQRITYKIINVKYYPGGTKSDHNKEKTALSGGLSFFYINNVLSFVPFIHELFYRESPCMPITFSWLRLQFESGAGRSPHFCEIDTVSFYPSKRIK